MLEASQGKGFSIYGLLAFIRAKILLLKYEGYTYEQIADKLDVCLSTVKSCVQRFLNVDIDTALNDRKGYGRESEISDSDITWVIHRACERKTVGMRQNSGIPPVLSIP